MNLRVSVEKRFKGFRLAADFNVTDRRTGVFGPSGSGKSTLMHLLADMLKPDRGIIELDGRVLYDAKRHIHVPPEQRRIGVVFQQALLFPHLNVRRNLMYGFRRIPADERKISPRALIDLLSLGHLLDRNVNRLSGGERQRVALGRTILACPRLILMDEPLTGLDRELKYQIIPYLKKVPDKFDMPLMFISHSLREMRLMTDDVLVLDRGRLTGRLSSEKLARQHLASGEDGYSNLLTLKDPDPHKHVYRYRWGTSHLIAAEAGQPGDNLFELPSREITLFKRHPEASSARNLLHGTVTDLFTVGNLVGVEIACGGEKLISQIVPESVDELGLKKGEPVIAAVKASAFRKLI
jgi:molybdate transport system ATP-binding protein